MAEPKANELMEKIVSLCKRRGFIYQSSEIYGGINGFWDYGPLGAELKRNVKEAWWSTMTRLRDDVVGLDATIIMHPRIWEASGHVSTFADPMSTCRQCKKLVRSDQAIEIASASEWFQLLHQHFQDAACAPTFDREAIASLIPKVRKSAPNLALVRNTRTVLDRMERTASAGLKVPVPPREIVKDPTGIEPSGHSPLSDERLFFRHLATENIDATGLVYFPCPHCGGELTDPRPFNLMFKTYVGPVESEDNISYLRPETAQAIFAQFKNVAETSRQKVPFGIGQIGKAFRNEVTPRNYTFRSREFEQMELEFFIKPDEAVEAISGAVAAPAAPGHPGEPQPGWGWQLWHQYWVEERLRFYEGIGLPRTSLEEYWQKKEELAHYARACVDILFKFPFGTQELEGIAARSDFDLSQHERCAGKPMGVFDDELRAAWGKLPKEKQDDLWRRYYENRKNYLVRSGVEAEKAAAEATEDANGLAKGQYIPHVIEPSAGVDRLILALLCNAYTEDTMPDEKGNAETRVLLKFHPRIAPIKVAVLPLLKNKPDLVKKALEIRDLLRPWMNVYYDDGGAIGRRYRRQDEAGTPFCVTVDFETFEGVRDGALAGQRDTVTLRHRDDGRQERLPLSGLLEWLLPKIR